MLVGVKIHKALWKASEISANAEHIHALYLHINHTVWSRHILQNTCIRMLIAELLVKVKNCKQPKFSSTVGRQYLQSEVYSYNDYFKATE